jgi:hypothetical protein
MSAGSVGVDGLMGPMMQPAAYTTAMMTNNMDMQQQMMHMQQLQRLQQQQQHSGQVVLPDALSPTQQAQLQVMQQQTGMACISQQMMPVHLQVCAASVWKTHGDRYPAAAKNCLTV